MLRSIARRLTYANVVASLALFIALGGVSYAATQLPKNSVGSTQLKKGSVTKAKLNPKLLASLTGKTGPAGAAGLNGANGAAGITGGSGAAGSPGANGANGAVGGPGPAGADGDDGADGAPGVAGTPGADTPTGYAYIYSTGAQVVAIESAVAFSNTGLVSGFIHAPGSSQLAVIAAGTYELRFSLASVEPSQFALFVNGSLVPGSTYGSGAGTQPNAGTTLVALEVGDEISLRNHSSAAAVTLQTLAGGTQSNVVASLSARRLS